MARIVLEIDCNEFVKGDMLIYDGKKFKTITKDYLLKDIITLSQKINKLEHSNKVLKATIDYDHGVINKEEYNRICGSKM